MKEKWQGQSRGGRTGYLIFIFLIRHFGLYSAYALLAVVAAYFIIASPRATVDIWLYARKILGYGRLHSALFAYKSYFSFGLSIIDKFAISAGLADKFNYEFRGGDEIESIMESGKGAIIIGAHFGNWAAGESFFCRYKACLNFVMFDNEHEGIKEAMGQNKSSDTSFKIIPVNKDSLAHVFMITEALDRGEIVCFMGDRYVNDDKLMDGTLMGHPAKFPSGPFLLASRLNVPVLFYFSVRNKNMTYCFRFVKAKASADRKTFAYALLNQYTEILSEEIKEHPEQWYNYYDYWNLRGSDKKVDG